MRHTYAFIGLGLIGGSLARCIKKRYSDSRIYAYTRSPQTLTLAMDEGIIDDALAGPDDPLISSCDMIFLCAPVESNMESLRLLAPYVSPSCLITDVGSVKTGIHQTARSLGLTAQFIGGHPMTGSEKSGLAASNDHLFENAYYFLTPEKDVPPEWVQEYHDLVYSFLAIPLVISCEKHDLITAAVSHLPHVIAAALVNTVHQMDDPAEHMKMIAAGGFKDITRIASSSPDMWEQICVTNNENISLVMDTFISLLLDARKEMNAHNGKAIHRMFSESREYRDSFSDLSAGGMIKPVYRIYCDVIDEAGAIATIATLLAVSQISIKNIGIIHNREFEEGALRIDFYDHESAAAAASIIRHHRYQVWEGELVSGARMQKKS